MSTVLDQAVVPARVQAALRIVGSLQAAASPAPWNRHVPAYLHMRVEPFGPQRFTWGVPLGVHHVGDYTIVQYERYSPGVYDPEMLKDRAVNGEMSFKPFVGGEDIGKSFESLDMALLGAIAWRTDFAEGGFVCAANSQTATYAARVLGIGT
jgi:hypothetical protein